MASTLTSGSPQAIWRDCVSRIGAEPIIEHRKTGMLLVLVPGGKFLCGDAYGKGKFEVELPPFYVGMQVVTNREYARFLSEADSEKEELEKWVLLDKDCYVRKAGSGYAAYGGKEDHPVVQVSWFGAQAYCVWAGLRLPRELEWEKAARGVDGRKFPWGKEWDEKRYRNSKNRGSETTARVWSYAECASPYGAYQTSGNVWEWCEEWYEEKAYDRYKRGDLKPPASGSSRVLRGASWHYGSPDYFSASARNDDIPGNRGDNRGFRCVMGLGVFPDGGSQ